MAMYEVGTVTGAANQAKVTGISTKWSEPALGIQEGSILVIYRNGSADLYAIKSVNNDTQLTLTRNITTAFSGAKYGIITSETASTSSFANQLASAFTLWRNVVQGWSTALTGSGNITMTDPITGTQVTVPAIAGMAKASDLDALAKLSGGNNLAGSQIITSDSSGFILGKNSDLALLKKQGQGGTIAVGSGTPFRVQRSRATTVSPADTFDDILVIDANNRTTLPGALTAGGDIDNTTKGLLYTQAIELSFSTPYIDFHFNYSTDDFTGRIMATAADQISVQGSHWRVDRDLRVGGMADIGGWAQCGVDLSANRTDFGSPADGSLVSGGRIRSRMLGRGGNGDTSGAWGGFYLEEYVGYNHRVVLYMDGFDRKDAWLFYTGGTISTPKGDVMTTGSDVRLKKDFTDSQKGASKRINALGVCEFNMKGETRRRRGFIAQQAEKVDPIYTFQSGDVEIDGEKINILNVDQTAIVADLVTTVQEQCNCIEKLKEELKNLKDLVMQTPETAA
ncbi:tail fiber domain-containing protein [Klebsiella pneumoniae]|uniref:tail fiber domain-containing protein n=1 Tax=Klebsiella pneumoniae TaxID=573 RepID=UPI000E2C288D|nr:tail fiber domain-containing protein [Klebsiella pneumoniae]SXQ03240.1 putative phage tail protein [Klebsiella pneumoniae]VUI23750.1 putative phage tail protein [Klebsiella pneumoniae]